MLLARKLAFDVGGLGFEFCVFVAGWRHALRSGTAVSRTGGRHEWGVLNTASAAPSRPHVEVQQLRVRAYVRVRAYAGVGGEGIASGVGRGGALE